MSRDKNFTNLLPLFLLFLFVPQSLLAMEIRRVPGVEIKNDILLSPSKVELHLDPGETLVRYLNLQNRTGKDMIFKVEVEDFSPSEDPYGGVILDKTVVGLNSSLKKYLSTDSAEFMMSHGEQARIPVTVTLPKGAHPGGLYAAVLISGSPAKSEVGAAKVVTRLGALFFVKVNGEVLQSGVFKDLSFRDNRLEIVFENNGDIYLNPYGTISIYDDSKELVNTLELDPWFVLPKSTRSRIVSVGDLDTGKYTASVAINRGYGGVVDNKVLDFNFESSVDNFPTMFWISILFVISLMLLIYKFVL